MAHQTNQNNKIKEIFNDIIQLQIKSELEKKKEKKEKKKENKTYNALVA